MRRRRPRPHPPAAWAGRPWLPEPVVAEQDVGEQDQLAHDGDQGDLRRLAAFDQLPVLAARSDCSGWRSAPPCRKPPRPRPAALDAASALPSARLARHRHYPRQAGGGVGTQRAQFRHLDDEAGDGADARDRGQHLGPPRQFRTGGEQPADIGRP